jgi:transcriptional regulator with XRE-family HTH domain
MDSTPEVLLASTDLVELGKRLRSARSTIGMTQSAAAGSDVSAAYISRIEAGQRRPEAQVLRQIAARLGTTIDYLVTGVEPAQAEELRLTVRYAELALKSGEATEAESQLRLLYESDTPLGAIAGEVRWFLALSLEALGRVEEAIDLIEDMTLPATVSELQVAIALCRCYRITGDLARAIDVGEKARTRAQESGLQGTDDEIRLTVTLVAAFHERGDVAFAARLCRRAIASAEASASSPARAAAYWNASILASNRSEPAEAMRLADRALALLSEGDDDRNLARLRTLHGLLMLRQDPPDVEAAHALLTRSEDELRSRDGSASDIAHCQIGIAHTHLLAGDCDEAIVRATAALEVVRGTSPAMSAEAEVIIGRAEAARGDIAAARTRYRSAIAFLTIAQADRQAAQLWYQLGDLLEAAGDLDGSRDAFRRSAASAGLRGVTLTTPTNARPQ